MYFNPPRPENNPANPFWHPLNQQQEAVSVELEFKSDAVGKKAGGKKVGKNTYMMTFKDNKEMNKFMDTHSDKLNESTAEYRAMMKRYKGSDMEKVFKILDKEGFRMGEQSDTLVRNMLKKHRGNVKKAADQIMKDNPGMFDVNRMMMDHVELDEAVKVARNSLVTPAVLKKFDFAKEYNQYMRDFKRNANPGDGLYVLLKKGLDKKKDKEIELQIHAVSDMMLGPEIKKLGDIDDLGGFGRDFRQLIAIKEEKDVQNEEKIEIPANVKKIAKELDDAVALHSSQSQRLKDAGIEDDEDMPKGVRDIPKELDKAVAKHKTQADRLRKSGVSEGFASDAQRRAAFASGYKAKGKKKGKKKSVEESYAGMTNIDWFLNDLTWTTVIIKNTFDGVESGQYNAAFDWNGDGVLDMDDVFLAIELWQQGLGVMYATDYQRMLADMEAGRRSNVNKGGAQMQIGTRFGSKTSRPPAAPPDMSTGAGGR